MLGMNTDEIKSLLVKILLIALGPLATKFSIDGNTTTAVATWLATGVILAYGIYDHWNMKKVPENAKVLAVLLAIGLCLFAFPARAQVPAPAPPGKPTLAQILGNPQLLFAQFSQNLIGDLQNALADAKAQTPPDVDSVNCYSFLLTLANSPLVNPNILGGTPGVFTAIQKGRDVANNFNSLTGPSGPLSGLNSACAAWAADNRITLAQIAVRLGLVAGAAGAKIAIGGLTL